VWPASQRGAGDGGTLLPEGAPMVREHLVLIAVLAMTALVVAADLIR
jgi:hypothetical protein